MRVLAVVVSLCSVAACSGPEPEPGPSTSAACDVAAAAVPDPSDGYRVVGNVAVPDAELLQPEENPGGTGPTAKFAKWGLLVRGGTSAGLSLPPGWEDRARIGWGQPGEPSTSLTLTACPATSWSVFTGGTWVSAPACVPILISTAGRQTEVRVAVGVPCPA